MVIFGDEIASPETMMGSAMPPASPSPIELDQFSLWSLASWDGHFRSAIFGLCAECTFGGNPAPCPFHEVRKSPMRDRIAWARDLSDADCKPLYVEHLVCAQTRLADRGDLTSATAYPGAPD
jgi:hypothetical protein